jgi:putative selenium metabolism protein SsnA
MLKYVLKNATLVTLYPASVEQADLRIADGKIVEKAKHLDVCEGETVLDLAEKIIMPGMVCAHTHLYSALARGMPGPQEPPANFTEILEKIWWRLDRSLDEESIYYSTVVGVLDAIASGTTTIIDHHASPGCIRGSLKIMKTIFEEIGVRGILCYEVTDRGGMRERDWGIEENRWMLEHQSEWVKGLVGAHAAFTLSDESLHLCAELIKASNSGVHIHVAEDLCDVKRSFERYGKRLIARLQDSGVLNQKSILAHGVHLSPEELQHIQDIGCWLVHNPRSNMNNSVGYFNVPKVPGTLDLKLALGTDGITSNMFEEVKFAYFKAQDAKNPLSADDCMRLLVGGHKIASEMFGIPLGILEEGATADLIILAYPAPTPLQAGNLSWHVIFGMSHAHVESVMVAGKFLVHEHRFVSRDVASLYQKAQAAAKKLWERMGLC